MLLKSSVALLLISSVAKTYAQNDPTPDGCVDPVGYSKCAGEARSNFISCGTNQSCSNFACGNMCETSFNGAQLGCWIQSCWNQVCEKHWQALTKLIPRTFKLPSCYYQDQVIYYLNYIGVYSPSSLDSIRIPFYPPPTGVGGACGKRPRDPKYNYTPKLKGVF